MNEANRLARCLGMTQCSCTPIFELTEQLIGHMGATVVRACLEGDERGHPADAVRMPCGTGWTRSARPISPIPDPATDKPRVRSPAPG